MMNNTPLDPKSFDQAYAVLKRNAEFLSSSQEPSIDQLLPLVEESLQAYQICKDRLAAIQHALASHWEADMPDGSADTRADEQAPLQ